MTTILTDNTNANGRTNSGCGSDGVPRSIESMLRSVLNMFLVI